ncbi:MAG: putative maltokinase, partial [Burkholderiales bacterium]|nr:putative maltokinase [Burkholderiales bacterium]
EQTNTGVFFGNRAYLKGYRRLQAGVNPELEIGRFLTVSAPFPHIAPVAGALEYVAADGERVTLAVLQAYVENQGSLWEYSLDYLERYLAAFGVQTEPVERREEQNLHAFFVAQAHRLGRRLGQLHEAFARTTGEPAFDPEPVTAEEIESWRTHVRDELVMTFDQLERRRSSLPETMRALVDRVLALRLRLIERLDALQLHADGLMKTRYHGDLHFGQVLIAQKDYLFVDFEGEPGRPLAERRRKHCPLRDVAGMVRSADYCARTVLTRLGAGAVERQTSLLDAAREWRRVVTAAFIEGYRQTTAHIDSVPRDPVALRDLLELFIIEKALYEVRYELDHRPDWLDVPIGGLLELAEPRPMH